MLKKVLSGITILLFIGCYECGVFNYNFNPDLLGSLKVHRIPATWHDARLRCKLEGGVLASPVNRELYKELKKIVLEWFPTGIYTGIHATFSKGDYFSVEGYILDKRTGSCYKLHTVGRTWPRAFMACSAEGAHLAIINSKLEAQVITELFAKHPDSEIAAPITHIASIGFHNWGEFRGWTTIHGETIQEAGYSTFEPGQPDDMRGGPYCGAIFRSGGLDDLSCDLTAPFICEKPQQMMPSANVQIIP